MITSDALPYVESVDIKINRASHHLNDLRSRIAEVRRRKPYEIVRQMQPDGRTEVFEFHAVQGPPAELSAVLGDFLTNCRATLDHLAFALHVVHSGIPNPADEKKIEFPIALEASRWSDISERRIWGMHPTANTVIERAQPYHGTNPATEPLGLLYGLSNIDKHRTVHFAYYQFISVNYFGSPTGQWLRAHTGILEDGAEVAAFLWNDEPQPDVNFVFSCDVSLREGPGAEQRIVLIILKILAEVFRIRDKLVPFLLK